ncbi:MAG: voltage-gated potassium channel [Oceanicoccus sp.]|jgi:voltage-gated potassium channel
MTDKHFHDWIGLSGVDSDENINARRWAKRLELPLLIVALWILVSWYWTGSPEPPISNHWLNLVIWSFFVLEAVLLTSLVDDKANYLKNNWLNVLIILCGLPVLWLDAPFIAVLRSLRLLIFISLLLQLSSSVRHILASNHLGATLLVSAVFIVFAGYLIAGVDPGIRSPADGIWWAWVTVTTVGYGDIVPTSAEGRTLAGILILLGIGLFSIITANISVYFIANSRNLSTERLDRVEQHLARIELLLEQQNVNKQSTEKQTNSANTNKDNP